MCGLDGTLIGLTPVFKEIWASEFMFGTKELVNNYVLHRTDRHSRPITVVDSKH